MIAMLLYTLSLMLSAISIVLPNFYIATWGVITVYMADFIVVWKKRNDRGILLFFLLAFFTFMLARIFINTITGIEWWSSFSNKEATVVLTGTYLALIFIPVGIVLGEHTRLFKNSTVNSESEFIKTSETSAVQRIAIILFWSTLAANVYEVLDRVLFVLRNSYLEAYLSYSGVNTIVSRLADINKIAFFLLLATFPSKQRAKCPIIVWVVINLLTILSGGRTTAVLTMLVLLYYYTYRNNHLSEDEEPWLTRRMKRAMIIVAPVLIIFLAAWNYLRNSRNVELGFLELFFDFFEAQGGAYRHLAYACRYADQLPQKFYTFGPVINFLRGNVLAKTLTGFRMPAQNTVKMATTGYSFGQAVSYLEMPWNYLAGLGMGSSYLAELYYDFGFIGIVLFNTALGAMFSKLSRVSPNRTLGIFFMLVILDSTLNLPRNACMAWFTSITSITLWGTLLLVYVLTRRQKKCK